MLIGELAQVLDVSRDTIRFYEKEGLIQPVGRRDNNYREYSDKAVQQLRFIRDLQERGFTLTEIRDLLEVSADGSVTCGGIGERIRAKLAQIDSEIAALEETRKRLQESFKACSGNSKSDVCAPIAEMRLG